MNKYALTGILVVTISLLFVACDDVLEEDISDKNITIVSPLENATVVGNTVPFQWQAVNGADTYTVQVRNASNVILVDSTVNTNALTYPLTEGTYSWRVKGGNFAYQTPYTFPVTFKIEASTDLSIQEVILNTPSDNFYTNNTNNVVVTWTGISTATSYNFALDKNVSGAVSTVDQAQGLTGVNYTIPQATFTGDAAYIWKVKALNATSQTNFSTRTIKVDTEVPGVVSFASPAADFETTETTIQFQWNNATETGVVQSPLTSVLEIATSSTFASATMVQTYEVNAETKSHTFSGNGVYYWRVRNKDAAGNNGVFGGHRKLTIN